MQGEKLYFTHNEDDCAIKISEDVLAAITVRACLECEGVTAMANISGSTQKGVVVTMENGTCSIDAHIFVGAGITVIDVAKSVQAAVKNAVEAMTGINPTAINVYVAGIDL